MLSKYFSKWGFGGALFYLAIAFVLFKYAMSCVGYLCGLVALSAAMPWIVIVNWLNLEIGVSGWPLFWIFVALNAIIIYFIFYALQRRFGRT